MQRVNHQEHLTAREGKETNGRILSQPIIRHNVTELGIAYGARALR
jgi:hypothetical protein